jgi:hypothetical protein
VNKPSLLFASTPFSLQKSKDGVFFKMLISCRLAADWRLAVRLVADWWLAAHCLLLAAVSVKQSLFYHSRQAPLQNVFASTWSVAHVAGVKGGKK